MGVTGAGLEVQPDNTGGSGGGGGDDIITDLVEESLGLVCEDITFRLMKGGVHLGALFGVKGAFFAGLSAGDVQGIKSQCKLVHHLKESGSHLQ